MTDDIVDLGQRTISSLKIPGPGSKDDLISEEDFTRTIKGAVFRESRTRNITDISNGVLSVKVNIHILDSKVHQGFFFDVNGVKRLTISGEYEDSGDLNIYLTQKAWEELKDRTDVLDVIIEHEKLDTGDDYGSHNNAWIEAQILNMDRAFELMKFMIEHMSQDEILIMIEEYEEEMAKNGNDFGGTKRFCDRVYEICKQRYLSLQPGGIAVGASDKGITTIFCKPGGAKDKTQKDEEAVKKEITDAGAAVMTGTNRCLFNGQECYDFAMGAEPTDEDLADMALISPLKALTASVKRLTGKFGSVELTHTMGVGEARAVMIEIMDKVSAGVEQHRIHCAISKTVLDELEMDEGSKVIAADTPSCPKGITAKFIRGRAERPSLLVLLENLKIKDRSGGNYGSIDEFLSERTMLDVIDDKIEKGYGEKPGILAMPYGRVALHGLARLNVAHFLAKGRADDEEGYKQAVSVLARTIGLLSNNPDTSEIFDQLIAMSEESQDPQFFIKARFEISLPPVAKNDVESIRKAWRAEAEALRAL